MIALEITIREQLPALAAHAEGAAEAAMANGRDPHAALLFRVAEAADRLFLALKELHESLRAEPHRLEEYKVRKASPP